MPSQLKSQARIARLFRSSGIDLSSLAGAEEGALVEKNKAFGKCVEECVELLELLGMPVLKAKEEAEALCAQLNLEGYVDACITADSDAFLYGAQCVIKQIQPNSKGPFECYYISDIESSLALKRNHLIAVSLLIGNDHDLKGIDGIGLETAVRFVKCFTEDEILNRLHEVARGDPLVTLRNIHSGGDEAICISDEEPSGFKCYCSSCDLERKEKETKKSETCLISVCRKISSEESFPNDETIQMYLRSNHGIDDRPCIGWVSPHTEKLVDYLSYYQSWEPSFIRQRLLPMLSTIYLREMASNLTNNLVHGQFKFHSIERVKIRYGHQFYLVKWKQAATITIQTMPEESDDIQQESDDESLDSVDKYLDALEEYLDSLDESLYSLDKPNVPHMCSENGHCFLLSDEDMELVQNAFPEKTNQFWKEKELKEMKQRKKSNSDLEGAPENSELIASHSIQFYRLSKDVCPIKRRKEAGNSSDFSESRCLKSVRRRLSIC